MVFYKNLTGDIVAMLDKDQTCEKIGCVVDTKKREYGLVRSVSVKMTRSAFNPEQPFAMVLE